MLAENSSYFTSRERMAKRYIFMLSMRLSFELSQATSSSSSLLEGQQNTFGYFLHVFVLEVETISSTCHVGILKDFEWGTFRGNKLERQDCFE